LQQQNFWLQQQKKIFVVPNFVAVTKPFFFRGLLFAGKSLLTLKGMYHPPSSPNLVQNSCYVLSALVIYYFFMRLVLVTDQSRG